MSSVTVSLAARLTGKSRETINTACNEGTLTATKNAQGVKVIDVSELARVYPLVKTMEDIVKSEPVRESQTSSDSPSDLREQLAVLKVQLQSTEKERDMVKAERERERRQLEEQIETLRAGLEKAQEQGGNAMRLLTHQSGEKQGDQSDQMKALTKTVELVKRQNHHLNRKLKEQEDRTFWRWLTGGGRKSDLNAPKTSLSKAS